MRKWGEGAFDNSAAMDWLGGLASGMKLADLRAAAGAHADDAHDLAIANAARAMIAAFDSGDPSGLPTTAQRWLARQSGAAKPSLAKP